MATNYHDWIGVETISSRKYKCGHCGNNLVADKGYLRRQPPNPPFAEIVLCHFCFKPTYFADGGVQIPGAVHGEEIKGIQDAGVAAIYNEARNAVAAGSPTAAVLCCRKLLMQIAVSKGAKEGDSFVSYVRFLCDNGYVPPDARGWVEHIKDIGNEANHEIKISPVETAKELIDFCEMLLKVIFEFPSRVKKKNQPLVIAKEVEPPVSRSPVQSK